MIYLLVKIVLLVIIKAEDSCSGYREKYSSLLLLEGVPQTTEVDCNCSVLVSRFKDPSIDCGDAEDYCSSWTNDLQLMRGTVGLCVYIKQLENDTKAVINYMVCDEQFGYIPLQSTFQECMCGEHLYDINNASNTEAVEYPGVIKGNWTCQRNMPKLFATQCKESYDLRVVSGVCVESFVLFFFCFFLMRNRGK
jgi:hypothetical protein